MGHANKAYILDTTYKHTKKMMNMVNTRAYRIHKVQDSINWELLD